MQKQLVAERRLALRAAAILTLGGACTECDSEHALEIDHVIGGGMRDALGEWARYRYIVSNPTQCDYQLLCGPCNKDKRRDFGEHTHGPVYGFTLDLPEHRDYYRAFLAWLRGVVDERTAWCYVCYVRRLIAQRPEDADALANFTAGIVSASLRRQVQNAWRSFVAFSQQPPNAGDPFHPRTVAAQIGSAWAEDAANWLAQDANKHARLALRGLWDHYAKAMRLSPNAAPDSYASFMRDIADATWAAVSAEGTATKQIVRGPQEKFSILQPACLRLALRRQAIFEEDIEGMQILWRSGHPRHSRSVMTPWDAGAAERPLVPAEPDGITPMRTLLLGRVLLRKDLR